MWPFKKKKEIPFTNLHELSYKIESAIQGQPANETYPVFRVVLDGHAETQTYMIFPLEKSLQKSGIYPILNCTCGEWGCGGFSIDVEVGNDTIVWKKIYIPGTDKEAQRLHTQTPITFNKKAYEGLVKKLLALQKNYKWENNVYETDKREFEKTGKFSW